MKKTIVILMFLCACGGTEFETEQTKQGLVLGPVRPYANGLTVQFSPVPVNQNWSNVDENSCDGNTTYNYEQTLNQRDEYKISINLIPNGSQLLKVAVAPCMAKYVGTNGDGKYSKANMFIIINGTTINASSDLQTDLTTFVSPGNSTIDISSLGIIKNSLTSLQIGVKYAGCSGSGCLVSQGVKISQMTAHVTYL